MPPLQVVSPILVQLGHSAKLTVGPRTTNAATIAALAKLDIDPPIPCARAEFISCNNSRQGRVRSEQSEFNCRARGLRFAVCSARGSGTPLGVCPRLAIIGLWQVSKYDVWLPRA